MCIKTWLSKLRRLLASRLKRMRSPRCMGRVFKRVVDPSNPRLECLYVCQGDKWVLHRCGSV